MQRNEETISVATNYFATREIAIARANCPIRPIHQKKKRKSAPTTNPASHGKTTTRKGLSPGLRILELGRDFTSTGAGGHRNMIT
jgi:hypothetical protein